MVWGQFLGARPRFTLINKHNGLLGWPWSHGYLFIGLISVGVWHYSKMLIDDTSIRSCDHFMGLGTGRLH